MTFQTLKKKCVRRKPAKRQFLPTYVTAGRADNEYLSYKYIYIKVVLFVCVQASTSWRAKARKVRAALVHKLISRRLAAISFPVTGKAQ